MIVDLEELIEAGLLLEEVEARRLGRFLLEREVQPLVTPVLLGLAGADALDRDTEA